MYLGRWFLRKRVGVVGLPQAGKTVMIISLLDHLQNHSPRSRPIGIRHGEALAADD